MSDQLPPLKENDYDGETVPNDPQSTRANRPINLPSGQGHVTPAGQAPRQPMTRRPPQQRRRERRNRKKEDNAFYLPLWSIAVMMLVVLGISFGIVFLIANLGGSGNTESSTNEDEAIVRIITAAPSATPAIASVIASPTLPIEINLTTPQATVGNLTLSGPTLEPVIFTSTPETIAVGKVIVVIDVGTDKLNVRDVPGVTTSEVLFRADEGTAYVVVEGPSQADGFTWWKIQDPANPNITGWAASNYIQVASQE